MITTSSTTSTRNCDYPSLLSFAARFIWVSALASTGIHAFQPQTSWVRTVSVAFRCTRSHEIKWRIFHPQQYLTTRNHISISGETPLHSQPYDDRECELYQMGYSGEGICLPEPTPDLSAEDAVRICMGCLLTNDEPKANAGLEVCFNFSSDRCRAALGGSLENFILYASNPTFGSMINAKEWTKAKVGPIIAGTNTRGAMQTVLVDLKPASGRDRRFLWTMQQERRPPNQGCWLVHECIYVENAYSLTL